MSRIPKVGTRVWFYRGKERCEGFCTIEAFDPTTRECKWSPMPEGIRPGDTMVIETEMDFVKARERFGSGPVM